MCMPKTPKYTPPPAPPAPPAPPPQSVEKTSTPRILSQSVQQARLDEQKQARLKTGRSGTVLTNPSLVNTGQTAATGKTLLGQ